MKFNEVEKSLKEGKKIKLKSWKNAYWYYDQENGVITVSYTHLTLPTKVKV